jgi:hypothetical protein
VVCSGILEYLNSPPSMLRDLNRRLRPSGTLVCTYFNDSHLLRQASRLALIQPYRHPGWRPLLSLNDLHEHLSVAGFSVRGTFASTLGPGPAPAVHTTIDCDSHLSRITGWSKPFAHQFVIECIRVP